MKSIELTQDEINEVCAKLANQLETYGDSASDELKNAFMKMMNAELTFLGTVATPCICSSAYSSGDMSLTRWYSAIAAWRFSACCAYLRKYSS